MLKTLVFSESFTGCWNLIETKVLKAKFNAEIVKCYDHRLRENVAFRRDKYGLNDPLLREGPAQGDQIGLFLPCHLPSS